MKTRLTCLLFLAILVSSAFPKCSKGCLNCSKNGECMLCDFYSNLYLSQELALKTITLLPSEKPSATETSTTSATAQGTATTGPNTTTANTGATTTVQNSNTSTTSTTSNTSTTTSPQGTQTSGNTSPTESTTEQNQCGFKFVDECSRHYIQGDCKECRTGFVMDRITNKCLKVSSENKIENCLDYVNEKCIRCVNGFLLQENKCIKSFYYRTQVQSTKDSQGKQVKTTVQIPLIQDIDTTPPSIFNCEVYEPNDPAKCQKCDKGYYLTSDFKCSKYVDFPKYDPNCASVTTFRCYECQAGYALVNNSFLDRTFSNLPASFSDVYSFLQGSAEGYMAPLSDNSCLPESIPGCKTYTAISTCKQCKDGYALNLNKGCDRVSSASEITYCKVYLNSTKCLQCQKFFKLSSDNKSCLISKYIEKCKVPKADLMVDGCLECEEGYFKSNDDVCRKRTSYPYDKCKTPHPTYDYCQTCEEHHQLSLVTLKCIPIPSNCLSFALTLSATPFYQCHNCAEKYFYNPVQKTCVAIPIANCRKYDPFTSSCLYCDSKYYEKKDANQNSNCLKHDLTLHPTCQIYSPTAANKCIYCGSGCLIPDKRSQCQFKDARDFCLSYDFNSEKCVSCYEGYYLDGFGKCQMIDYRRNCRVTDVNLISNLCWKCSKGYFREFVGEALVDAECQPNFRSTFVNCDSWAGNSQKNVKCVLCSEGYTVDMTNNSCILVSACTGTVRLASLNDYYEFTIFDDFFSFCDKEGTLADCGVEALSNADDGTRVCIDCGAAYSKIVDVSDSTLKHHSFYPENSDYKVGSPISTFTEVKECMINSDGTFAPFIIPNCEIYYKPTSSDNFYGCLRCEFGLTGPGKIINGTNAGLESCTNNMDECDASAKLFGLSFDFYNITAGNKPSINWDTIASCHVCSDPQKIPFYFLDENLRPSKFSLYVIDKEEFVSGSNGIGMRCVKPTKHDVEAFVNYRVTSDFTKNCAMGAMNTKVTKDNLLKLTDDEIGCVACKPGYRPTYAANGYVSACNEITNCDLTKSQTWFNKCSNCSDGNGYVYDANISKAVYTTCAINSDTNCAVTNGILCMFCKNGFIFDDKGFCVRLRIDGCLANETNGGAIMTDQNRLKDTFDYKLVYSPDFLFWVGQGNGCMACDEGFISVKQNMTRDYLSSTISFTRSELVQSFSSEFSGPDAQSQIELINLPMPAACARRITSLEKIPSNIETPITTTDTELLALNSKEYIPNCAKYSVYPHTFKQVCVECKSGFTISLSHKFCVKESSLPNCELALTTTKCLKCKSGFLLNKTYNCDANTISHCLEFGFFDSSNTMDSPQLRCFQCEAGYYSQDGKTCQEIQMKGCLHALNENTCLECANDYFLFDSMGTNQCRLIDLGSECSKGEYDLFTNEFHCVKCPSSGYVLKNQSAVDNVNYAYHKIDSNRSFFISQDPTPVENCISNNQTFFSFSENIFWKHIDRTHDVDKIDFSLNSHIPCLACKEGFYLNSANNTCVKRTHKDVLCSKMSAVSDMCQECQKDTFIHRITGACTYSPNKEAYCEEIGENGICMSCGSNRFPQLVLIDENGDELFSSNKYKPVTKAKSTYICSVLSAQNQILHCEAYNRHKRCVKCGNNRRLTAGQCIEINATNCITLITPFQCGKCEKGYKITKSTHSTGYDMWLCEKLLITDCQEVDMETVTIKVQETAKDPKTGENVTKEVDKVIEREVCLRCDMEKYFDITSRKCTAVTKKIENCEFYRPDQKCMFCKTKYLLSNQNTSCQVNLENFFFGDRHCLKAAVVSDPVCQACKSGFFLDHSNVCRPCVSQGLNSKPSNCALCSPKSPNQCLVCLVGFHMNESGICVAN